MSVIIIGGGLAGLYAASMVSIRKPDVHIHIFESSNRWGGRIFTVRKNGFAAFEGGAGRIGSKRSQPLLWALLKWLGLREKLVKISGEQSVTHIIQGIRTKDPKMQEEFGYDAEFELLDPDFARTYMLRHFQGPFYSLDGGLDQITDRLVEYLRTKPNVHMQLRAKVTRVSDSQVVVNDDSVVPFDKAIVCVTKSAFEKLFHREYPNIHTVELNRIFVTGQFRNEFKHKRTGPGPIRMWIPMGNDLYQVYTDSHWAIWWKERGDDEVIQIVSEFTGAPVTLVDREFWREGVHFHVSHEQFIELPQNVFVAGEMVSSASPGWMEGALESVRDLIERL